MLGAYTYQDKRDPHPVEFRRFAVIIIEVLQHHLRETVATAGKVTVQYHPGSRTGARKSARLPTTPVPRSSPRGIPRSYGCPSLYSEIHMHASSSRFLFQVSHKYRRVLCDSVSCAAVEDMFITLMIASWRWQKSHVSGSGAMAQLSHFHAEAKFSRGWDARGTWMLGC